MDDLIAFLKARLDEDEKTARRIKATRHGALIVSPGDGESPSVIAVEGDKLLREVEAKRRLLDFHLPEPLNEWDRKSYGFTLKCAGESWECYGDGEDIVPWPCDHLKLLALPYADHPDYQESWKP